MFVYYLHTLYTRIRRIYDLVNKWSVCKFVTWFPNLLPICFLVIFFQRFLFLLFLLLFCLQQIYIIIFCSLLYFIELDFFNLAVGFNKLISNAFKSWRKEKQQIIDNILSASRVKFNTKGEVKEDRQLNITISLTKSWLLIHKLLEN